ncbi:MAG: alpha/beta hydrolase [Planctomycetaceae bacterium]|nr:alpha/beta hydrolase [Planctomycetaceae bacterium]
MKRYLVLFFAMLCCCDCFANTLKIKQRENGIISIVDKKKNSEPNLIIGTQIKVPSDRKNIVIVTHGWFDGAKGQLAEDIASAIKTKADSNEWLCGYFEWRDGAMVLNAVSSVQYARDFAGPQLAKAILALGNFEHIHLIGHSAGCWVIDSAAKAIEKQTQTRIHLTFLDAYVPKGSDQSQLGRLENTKVKWIEHYYIKDITLGVTEINLTNAYNVDITHADPAIAEHKFPLRWYYATITGQYHKSDYRCGSEIYDEADGVKYGFARSLESGKQNWQKNLELKENKKAIMIRNQ